LICSVTVLRAAALVIFLVPCAAVADDERLQALEDDLAATQKQVDSLLPLSGRVSGYLDVGFFHAGGDGSGVRADLGNVTFPEYADVIAGGSWVFMGDPLSTAINSRGEPADTGESRAVTHDSVDSRGKASFIVNAVNVALFAGIGRDVTLNVLFDLVPRGRDVTDPDGTALGDFLDVKLAYAEYRPLPWLSLFAGRIDPVLGFEYRIQEAPDRLAVTPSLICRYTCGRPIGVKARARFLEEALVLNVALTNGSSFWEGFGISDDVDRNDVKTASARVSYRFPVGTGLEIGASGALGAQDAQDDDSVLQWHVGGDLHFDWRDLELTAEYVKGKAPGADEAGQPACFAAPCLTYQGAYGLVGYRATNWLIPYARVDWRDALHRSGASFIYVSELLRATAGVRLELGAAVIVKAEYTLNRELGEIPQFANDVFTSSLVVKY
jgi:hypothetical protein